MRYMLCDIVEGKTNKTKLELGPTQPQLVSLFVGNSLPSEKSVLAVLFIAYSIRAVVYNKLNIKS